MTKVGYIKYFIGKHGFTETDVNVQCTGGTNDENIHHVIFNTIDIPDNRIFDIKDIMFDIDSESPEDMFMQWVNSGSEQSYINWYGTLENIYKPTVENTEMIDFQNTITSAVYEIFDKFNEKYTLPDDFDDSDELDDLLDEYDELSDN